MADKKSFLIHKDSLHVLDELTDIEAGKLFKAIACYQYGEEIELDTLTKITFAPFKSQFNRDNEKYLKTCESRAASGSKGGLAKASKAKQELAKPSKTKQNLANLAESDNDNERDSESDKDNESDNGNNRKEVTSNQKEAIDYSSLCMTDDQITEVKRIRKQNKGGKITQRVIDGLAKEFEKAAGMGLGAEQILTEWEMRGWKSFKAEWCKPNGFAKADKFDQNVGALQSIQFAPHQQAERLTND